MASVLLNDRVLATAIGVLAGQRTMNTFVFRVSAQTPDNEMSAVLTALHAEMNKTGSIIPGLRGCCPTNWTLKEMWYQVIAPARYRKQVSLVNLPGLFGGPAAVCNVQASITRFSDQAKRSGVGGIRIPIAGDALAADNGNVHTNLATALQTLANAMRLNLITQAPVTTFIPQVGLPKDAMQSKDIFTAIPQTTVRTMHRRTVGLGI